jgi:hypothetical protein
MTSSDKKKTGILVLLLIVGGVSWYFFVYRPTLIPAADPAAQVAAAKSKGNKPPGDAQIHWPDPPGNLDVGQRNLFRYGQKPEPPKPAAIPSSVFERPTQPSNPPPPPPLPQQQPFKAFKYEGFSVIKNGKPLASLSEGGNTYTVREGECLFGQYCITRVTENVVEIQDTLLKRSQTFTRTTQ